jgi:hypothetical protein
MGWLWAKTYVLPLYIRTKNKDVQKRESLDIVCPPSPWT